MLQYRATTSLGVSLMIWKNLKRLDSSENFRNISSHKDASSGLMDRSITVLPSRSFHEVSYFLGYGLPTNLQPPSERCYFDYESSRFKITTMQSSCQDNCIGANKKLTLCGPCV